MKKIYEKVMSALIAIGSDKYMHFTVGVVLSVIIMAISSIFTTTFTATAIAITCVACVGAIKEVIDVMGDGVKEVNDFYATVAGGLCPMVAVWVCLI